MYASPGRRGSSHLGCPIKCLLAWPSYREIVCLKRARARLVLARYDASVIYSRPAMEADTDEKLERRQFHEIISK